MDRCPNCDAAVRPNAKFCTSCGFRLPTPEPAKQPDQWRSPFATTSNYEHNQTWTAPAPAPSPTAPPPIPAAPEPAAEAAPDADAAPVFAGWPNFSNSAIPADETALTDEPVQFAAPNDHPAPSETREPASAALVDAHAEELNDIARQYDERHGKNGNNQPFAWAAPLAPADESAPAAAFASTAEPAPAADLAPAVESVPNLPEAAAASEAPVDEPAAPIDAEPATPEPVGEAVAVDEPTEPIPAMSVQPVGGGVDRAFDLIDQLRALIPTLGAAAPTPNDARAILAAADVPVSDSDDLRALRGAIETANSRPRDIDVMLDLVSRAGVIREVLAERDRFAAAIQQALATTGDSKE